MSEAGGRLTVRVPHLLLARAHVGEVIHDRLGQVLESLQLHLKRLQLLRLRDLQVRVGHLHPFSRVSVCVRLMAQH